MYVIRFSKINIAQVSSGTLEHSLQTSLCQENIKKKQNNIGANRAAPTSAPTSSPFQFALSFYCNALKVTAAAIGT